MFGETVNHKSEDPHEMVMDAEQMRQQRFTITAHIKVDIYSKFNGIYLGNRVNIKRLTDNKPIYMGNLSLWMDSH